jgi:hypothetical protein
MDATQAARQIAELARQMGMDDVELDEDGTALLVVDEGLWVVAIGHHPGEAGLRLVICADNLLPTPEQAVQLMKTHFSWGDSAGITFALEPDSGALVLQRQVSDAQLAAETLSAIVTAMIDSAESLVDALTTAQAAAEMAGREEADGDASMGRGVPARNPGTSATGARAP